MTHRNYETGDGSSDGCTFPGIADEGLGQKRMDEVFFFFCYDAVTINLREVPQNNLLPQQTAGSAAFPPPDEGTRTCSHMAGFYTQPQHRREDKNVTHFLKNFIATYERQVLLGCYIG